MSIDEDEVRKEYTRPADTGEITEPEFFNKLAKLDAETPEEVRSEWLGLASINSELVALITELKTSYKIALCSNAPTPFLKELLKKNNLEHLFDVIIISSEVHLAKPDPAIFELALQQLGVQAVEAIFTDDNSSNVASAKSVGITSFLFTTTEQLRSDFREHDLII